MDRRYKKRAWLGVAAWALSPLVVLVLLFFCWLIFHPERKSGASMAGIIAVSFLVPFYVTFFWGGSQLTRAKGYSNGILVPGILGPPAQLVILAVLLFALPDRFQDPSQTRHRRQDERHESLIERTVRFRRNAFAGNVFGLVGILVALLVFFIRLPLAQTADGRHVLALGFFVPSYAAVLFGCSSWLKAKCWSDAVLLIGLLPLAILFVPFVRLIYRAAPMLLPMGMVFMPIIMIGVIAALPDKSGLPKRKRWDRD
jgi:hypothetical protein